MITAREILDKARASGHRLPYNEAAVLFAAAVRLAAVNDSTLRGWLVLIDEAGGLHVGVFEENAPEAEPAFLAPELMTADAPDKSDPKVQVYAAGVLGYELLSGKLALTPGQSPGAELSGALGEVVRRALSPDRRARIEDLRQLHEEVERVQPRPPAEGERNILSALRNRFSRPPPEKEAVAKLIDKLHHLEAQVAQLTKTQARLDAAHHQSLEAIERFEDGRRRAGEAGRRRQPVVAPAVIAGLFASLAVLAAAWALGMIASPLLPPLGPAPAASPPPPATPPAAPEHRPQPKPERKVEEKAPAVPDAAVAEPRSAPIDAGPAEADASALGVADAGETDAGLAVVPDAGSPHAAAPPAAPKPAPPPAAAKPAPARNPEAAMLHAVAISQVRRGESALEQGRGEEALESFRAAIENEPANAAAHRGLGMAYAMQGNDAQALQSYEKYLRLAPKAPDANEIRQSIGELKARAKQRANTQ
jgi:tetratricopeptide (TPR) repeat protein